jgi:hypothetical protein
MKKLEREALLADREAVKAVLSSIGDADPVGRLSFDSRLRDIEQELATLEAKPDAGGSVALLFAGEPVHGSRSIDVAFASKVMQTFQELISKRVASQEFGPLGDRGRIPGRSSASLAIRELVRGSVGFMLEEDTESEPLVDSAVKQAIDDVSDAIARTASQNEQDFEEAVERLDHRLLLSLREFFRTLDDERATVRIVEGERDSVLDAPAVKRGRQRVEMTDIDERETDQIVGELLGLLPAARRFEMRLTPSGEIIKGRVAADMAQRYLELIKTPDQDIVGRQWRTKMQVREVRERNKPPRNLYLLLGLLQQVHS